MAQKARSNHDGLQPLIDFKRVFRKKQRHSRKPSRPSQTSIISIVIPAHNEEDYIGLTLDAVNRQNYPHFEVIVVANGCADRTAEIASGNCDRLVVLSRKGLGVARNLGAKLARGELLVFLDADTLLEPGALEIIAHKFNRACAVGAIKGRPDSERLSHRAIYWAKNLMHRWSIHSGSSGVIICRRKNFVAAQGFDEELEVRENSELIARLKQSGRYRYIGEAAAVTSMRRYQRAGTGRTVCLWLKLWCQSLFSDLRGTKYDAVR